MIHFNAEPVAITAAAGKSKPGKRCEILAYAGGLIQLPGWGTVGIDLAGMDYAGQIPLLSDHDNSRRGVIGFGTAAVGP